MFLNNRYHDPVLGRFVSVDPLVAATRDAYGYGNNNPITYSDPTGLEPCSWCGSTETKHYGEDQSALLADLLAAIGVCSGGCGDSAADDDLKYLGSKVKSPGLDLGWAGCMVGGSVQSCGVPNYPADSSDGHFRSGSNDVGGDYVDKVGQLSYCASHGTTCGDIKNLGGVASDTGGDWRKPDAFGDELGNAMQHAYGFALFSSRTGYSDTFLRGFGYAHEIDGRDNWADTARDILNNETGIAIGNRVGPSGNLIAAIDEARRSGLLYCSAGGSVFRC